MGAGDGTRTSIGSDTREEELDPAVLLDLVLVPPALDGEVSCIAVEQVGILRLDVNVAEEVVPHEGVVALGVIARQLAVLVHVERHHVLEGHLAGLELSHQHLVCEDRRGASWQAEDEGARGGGLEVADALDHVGGHQLPHLRGVLLDHEPHDGLSGEASEGARFVASGEVQSAPPASVTIHMYIDGMQTSSTAHTTATTPRTSEILQSGRLGQTDAHRLSSEFDLRALAPRIL